MKPEPSDLLIRRKRVNELGEWEYECSECENWLEKSKFRGCVNFVDAYGNCLMCSSCRAKLSRKTGKENDMLIVRELLTKTGFYDYESPEAWLQSKLKTRKRK